MEELKPILDELNQVDPAPLKREGKDFSFEDVYSLVTTILNNSKLLSDNMEWFDLISSERQRRVKDAIKRFSTSIKEIQSFDPANGNPQDRRNQIANNIRNSYDNLVDDLFPTLDINFLKSNFSSSSLQKLTKEAQENAKKLRENEEKSTKIIEAMREVSADTGVSKFASVFEEQAKEHKDASRLWLVASVSLSFGIIICLIFVFGDFNKMVINLGENNDLRIPLQILISKLVLISFSSFILYQLVKNYNTNRHLYTLNKHRYNSMITFRSFVESTDDPKVKDVVLIEATRAIFKAGATGYVSTKDGVSVGIETLPSILSKLK